MEGCDLDENKNRCRRWYPTAGQKLILLNAYGKDKYPKGEEITKLVNVLNIYERETDESKVRHWFKNRRKREKEKEKEKEGDRKHCMIGSTSTRTINDNSDQDMNNQEEKIDNSLMMAPKKEETHADG